VFERVTLKCLKKCLYDVLTLSRREVIVVVLVEVVVSCRILSTGCLKSVPNQECKPNEKRQLYTWDNYNRKCIKVKACSMEGNKNNLFRDKSSCQQACRN